MCTSYPTLGTVFWCITRPGSGAELVSLAVWADKLDAEWYLSQFQDWGTTTALTNLETLTLSHGRRQCDLIKNEILFHHFRFPNLKKLSVLAPRSVTPACESLIGLHHDLRRFTKLEHIYLDIVHLGREAITSLLSAVPSVKTLSIRREFPLPNARYDEGCPITAIDHNPALLPKLETLILNCDQSVSARLAACHADCVLQLVSTVLQGEEDVRFFNGLTQGEREEWAQAVMGFRPHPMGWLKRIVFSSSDGKRAGENAKDILEVGGAEGRFEVIACCDEELSSWV